jgi:catechol 2,3-dioxygenase-like lactoylglutathione lyase family enzyme
MGLHHLDHYTIEAADIEATERFYCDLLGLYVGERPPLPFPGLWLYCENDLPTVHVIGKSANDRARPVTKTGLLHHISFYCTGAEQTRTRLEAAHIQFNVIVLSGSDNTQFFMKDPDGISVELNFPASETRESDREAMLSKGAEQFLTVP